MYEDNEVDLQEQAKTLRDVLYVVFRHLRAEILTFLLISLSVITYTYLIREVFQSHAKLLVQVGRESVGLDPTASIGNTITVAQTRENELNSELEILLSTDIAEQVVKTVSVEWILNPKAINEQVAEETSIDIARNLTRRTRAQVNAQLKSAESLLAELDLVNVDEGYNLAVSKVRNGFRASVSDRSNVLELSYECQNATLAQVILQKYIEFFKEKHIAVHQTSGSYEFFQEQIKSITRQLETLEDRRLGLLTEYSFINPSQDMQAHATRLSELKNELTTTESQFAAVEATVKKLRQHADNVSDSVVIEHKRGLENPPANDLLIRIQALRMVEQDLLTRYTETSLPVRNVRERIAAAQELLDKMPPKREETISGPNIVQQNLSTELIQNESRLSSLYALSKSLQVQIEQMGKIGQQMSQHALLIERLDREIRILNRKLAEYKIKEEESRMEQALKLDKITNISVVQSPTLPSHPIRPRKLRNIAFGLFFGIVGSIVLAFFLETVDRTFRTPEHIQQKLGIATFAAIPKLIKSSCQLTNRPFEFNQNGRIRHLICEISERLPFCLPVIGKGERTVPTREASMPSGLDIPERLRHIYAGIRDRLLLAGLNEKDENHTLGIISIRKGEGTSTVACNLAALLARHCSQRVLLVDANLHEPSLHRVFNLDNNSGFTNLLIFGEASEEVIQRSSVQNLDVLTAGQIPYNYALLSENDFYPLMLSEWKAAYKYVIFDLPAVFQEMAVARFVEQLEANLLIVEAERNRFEVELQGWELLKRSKFIGAILNKRAFPIPRWLYQYI